MARRSHVASRRVAGAEQVIASATQKKKNRLFCWAAVGIAVAWPGPLQAEYQTCSNPTNRMVTHRGHAHSAGVC